MCENARDQRRDVSHNQFRDQSIINQGWMRDIHYHLPHPPARADGAPHFLVPFPENKRFVAIVGLGGVGKTQVALQIAYHARTLTSWSVFWLSALSMAAFEQACTEMVERLRLSTSGIEETKQVVKGYLESSTSGRWLLVVDNADDVAMLMEPGGIYTYLPKNGDGCILFTTRAMDVAQAVADDIEELEEMSDVEAKAFLQKLLPSSSAEEEAMTELLRRLTYLPLAISQAAAYMKRSKTPVSKYLSFLHNADKEAISLLSREFPDRTRYSESRHAVAMTWLISFEQIQKHDWMAAELLSFLSQIEPRAVPQSMLPRIRSEESFVHAVGTLYGYAFLYRRQDGEMMDMHSLVHLAAQEWVRNGGNTKSVKRNVVSHLATVFQSDDWVNREVWRKYMPHVLKAIQVSEEGARWEEEECELGYWAGRCLQVEGRIDEAVELLQHVVKVQETTLAENHPSRLASQHELAIAYRANGQVKEAVELLQHVVKVEETILAENHPDRLASQHELAGAYQANGQVKEAVELLQYVFKVQETTLAENHPDRLASQHELARAYEANGQVKEAVELLQYVVKVQETTLAENHPDRLASQHALARAYQANGQVKEAVELLQHVVYIKSKIMAPAHPSRQVSERLLEQLR
ncbi:P-loop containing nucleoside triphosphate hydrolase protein [Stachybotrys elegans]|uniref:P-loop containing nucleoside triphosphate hydrolase protein n=1 Tax=Stachybotrys elegans TaxID=80388 RepID=A0A8K0WIP9_9HYPO|nr:P-loop containing nucleoside triphosphate hydrolase protein [Stachybotrys elegans]